MKYRDYLDIPHTPDLAMFATRLRRFGETTAREMIFRKKQHLLVAQERSAFDRAIDTESRACRDASVAAGHFPVVIYHPGAAGSFDENAVLFEFLASHGYVVTSSAYQRNTADVSNSAGGPSRSIRDMQFLLQTASELPFVDITSIAGVGHSAGAQFLMQWIGEEDCPLDAAVSLDTTLEYTPHDFSGHKELRQILNSLRKPSIPVMLFASAERHPNFATFDRFLQQSPRYEVTVSHLRHDEYVSQGAIGAELTETGKVSAADVRNSYGQLAGAVRYFLDSVLKGDNSASLALKQSSTQSAAPLKLRFRAPR